MIPLRLELKNFMSYGEDVPALDFAGMHTLCLSGENGHGKSALLDAMTWALWGESRAGKNKHDELVRIGADEMSVQFTFEMDGQVYRVLRKRSRRASGNQWELQHQTPDQGLGTGWRSLTGNDSRQTEQAIQKLLRMSYDTFLNSAYLRQGQADLFVRQPPGKRKEILGDILDLSRYDQLEAKARDRSKEAGLDAAELERDINALAAEIGTEPAHRAALADLHANLDASLERREALRAEWEVRRERQTHLQSQKQFADQLRRQQQELDADIVELDQDLARFQADVAQGRALLAREAEIARNYDALQELRAQIVTLEQRLQKYHEGQRRLAAVEKEWMAAEGDVQRRLERATADHEQAVARLQDYGTFQRDREKIAPRVAAADALNAERQTVQRSLLAVQEEFVRLREENARFDFQTQELRDRIATLSHQEGQCAVCNAPLPPEKITQTCAEYEGQLETLLAQRKAVRTEAARLKAEIATHQQRVQDLEAQADAANKDRVRLGQLEQRLLELDEIQKDLPNLEANRMRLAQTLKRGDFAPELRATLEKWERAVAALTGADQEYAAARTRLPALEPAERQFYDLGHARTSLASLETQLTRAEKTRAQRIKARAAVAEQLATVADVTDELARLEARILEIRAQEAQRSAEEQGIRTEAAGHQHALTRIEEQKAVRADKDARLAAAKKEEEIHKQLAAAFGKKGVQALIIENAIPELQEETNRILERLTDGDMSLYFETLREAKAKRDGPIETLDIKVSDNLGTRPLEMYSGGEGFRAAFALRIALSKLLARRAGARLQTLIIDEGFGTQDAKGREKLVEALNTIKSDFERIIVITHVDELKDAFATRVEISKTPTGSQITVLEGASG